MPGVGRLPRRAGGEMPSKEFLKGLGVEVVQDNFADWFPPLPAEAPKPEPAKSWVEWYRVEYPDEGRDDPRPDLDAVFHDSAAWTQVLRFLWLKDGKAWLDTLPETSLPALKEKPVCLYGIFDGIRRLGARFIRQSVGARLDRGEIGEEEYATIREKWLLPNAEEVKRILERVAW